MNNHNAFFGEIKSGVVHEVYFFCGPEEFIRKKAVAKLEEKLLMPGLEDLNRTVLNNPTAQQIIECCETLPMLCERRMVIVRGLSLLQTSKPKKKGEKGEGDDEQRDDEQDTNLLSEYLPRVPQSTCLVIEANSVDKRKKLCTALTKLPGAFSFDVLDDNSLMKWMNQTIRPQGKRMDGAACEALAFASGRDLTMLTGELAKLVSYVGTREQITVKDVEEIATHTAECTVFNMVEALAEGKAERAFTLLDILLQAGESRVGILALITRQYRLMLYMKDMQDARKTDNEIIKALGIQPFMLRNLKRQVGGRTTQQLREMVECCVRADYDFKRGSLREETALDRLMLFACSGQKKKV